ncbi:MAG: NUDIX domain-containing protein [Oscillospiraceae bacterium]|nr:NUDIX domain-containing protein [Oscillospiraceae bacterium]
MRDIRTSAKAVVIRDGRLLAVKISDGSEGWYILPGGGQDPEETLPQTVEREVGEETGMIVSCGELLFVIEGVHGESFHRIDMVFECSYIGESEDIERHADTDQSGCEWLDIQKLNVLPLYPSKLRRPIMEHYAGKCHKVYLGNEEIGDPECTG